jgi:hypothetical protein
MSAASTQVAFALYLRDDANALWEVDENDAYGLALDTLVQAARNLTATKARPTTSQVRKTRMIAIGLDVPV